MSRRDLYRDARQALAEADRNDAAAEAARWRAAKAMSELYDMGDTMRDIGAELGVAHNTVSRYIRVWEDYGTPQLPGPGGTKKVSFSNALLGVRGPSGQGHTPITTAKRAEIAAELLGNVHVRQSKTVREVLRKHSAEDFTAEVRATTAPKFHSGTPPQVTNATLYREVLYDMQFSDRKLKEAMREIRKTGLPNKHSGDLIRAARTLAATCEQFEALMTDRGVGRAG
jgi:hypothetical protein